MCWNGTEFHSGFVMGVIEELMYPNAVVIFINVLTRVMKGIL
jgi:hypothetical protein